MSETYNAAKDYFSAEEISEALKVVSSSEGWSNQTSNGNNTYGDPRVTDIYNEVANPSCTYEVIDELLSTAFTNVGGSIVETDAFPVPICWGGMSFTTGENAVPTVTINGASVQTGATQIRAYTPIGFKIIPRHRAQNCIGTFASNVFTPAIAIKISGTTTTVASDINDYGLSSVSGDIMPLEITRAQPKGVTFNYDIHGAVAAISYQMNWYNAADPVIELSSAMQALGATFSQKPTRGDEKDGYTQWSWAIQVPMLGAEYTPSSVG